MWMLVHMHGLTYGACKNRNAITRWLLPSISPHHSTASHYWMSRLLAHTYFVISICLQKWNIEWTNACATICERPFLPSLPFIHSFIQHAAASPLFLHESYWFTFISTDTCDFARQPHALWLDAKKCSDKSMLRAKLRSISNKDIAHYYYLESYLGNGTNKYLSFHSYFFFYNENCFISDDTISSGPIQVEGNNYKQLGS